MDYVKEHEGERILSTNDGVFDEFGVISGSAKFSIKDSFRYLHVPVEQLMKFDGKCWGNNAESGVHITPDIFSHPAMNIFIFGRGKSWGTDHSGIIYFGGRGPGETEIYVGNNIVDDQLKKSRKVIIPQQEKEVVFPNPLD